MFALLETKVLQQGSETIGFESILVLYAEARNVVVLEREARRPGDALGSALAEQYDEVEGMT